MKYTYNVDPEGHKVICVAHYAGKTFRGISKCDTDYDEFNVETGIQLAKLRCNKKVAKYKEQLAKRRFELSVIDLLEATSNEEYCRTTYRDATKNLSDIGKELAELENKLITT